MADDSKDFDLNLKTTADTSGAKEAKEAVEEVTEATTEATEATREATEATNETSDASEEWLKQVKAIMERLEQGDGTAVPEVVERLKKSLEETGDVTPKVRAEIEDLIEKLSDPSAAENFEDMSETSEEWLEKVTAIMDRLADGDDAVVPEVIELLKNELEGTAAIAPEARAQVEQLLNELSDPKPAQNLDDIAENARKAEGDLAKVKKLQIAESLGTAAEKAERFGRDLFKLADGAREGEGGVSGLVNTMSSGVGTFASFAAAARGAYAALGIPGAVLTSLVAALSFVSEANNKAADSAQKLAEAEKEAAEAAKDAAEAAVRAGEDRAKAAIKSQDELRSARAAELDQLRSQIDLNIELLRIEGKKAEFDRARRIRDIRRGSGAPEDKVDQIAAIDREAVRARAEEEERIENEERKALQQNVDDRRAERDKAQEDLDAVPRNEEELAKLQAELERARRAGAESEADLADRRAEAARADHFFFGEDPRPDPIDHRAEARKARDERDQIRATRDVQLKELEAVKAEAEAALAKADAELEARNTRDRSRADLRNIDVGSQTTGINDRAQDATTDIHRERRRFSDEYVEEARLKAEADAEAERLAAEAQAQLSNRAGSNIAPGLNSMVGKLIDRSAADRELIEAVETIVNDANKKIDELKSQVKFLHNNLK